MKRDTFLILLSAGLFIALILVVLFGCSCRRKEGFEGAESTEHKEEESPEEAIPEMTKEEKELFEDIQKGSLNDEEIQELVKKGKLTEQMVEKFLAQLDVMSADSPVAGDKKPKSPPKPVVGHATTKKPEVEAFEGSMGGEYAAF